MKDKNFDRIAAFEKAIADKYGSEAVQNPKANWDETKEKEDDIKEPKESKDTKKVGVPTGNYNTFGITYSVKANTVWNKKTQRWEQKDEY